MNELPATIYTLSSRLAEELPAVFPINFPEYLALHPQCCKDHPYLPDLAALEKAYRQLATTPTSFPAIVQRRIINPTVKIVEVAWKGLPEFIRDRSVQPQVRDSLVLLFRPAPQSSVQMITPTGHDLLALKLVTEGMSSRDAAEEAMVPIGRIDTILAAAVQRGLILSPPSGLRRDKSYFQGRFFEPEQQTVATFTLQWHLTQACDLNCRHCYDRSSRKNMELSQAIHVLDELYAFSEANHVQSQVSFSGGNPMLYPFFYELYREAVDRGFLVAILGNPMEEHHIERLLTIGQPEFYQVSLEGLSGHNDYIRGKGHYRRVLDFLRLLRKYRIYSMVMLTLTRANRHEVLSLAEELRGKVDTFTFNRLAMVGEGAELASLEVEEFPRFLEEFLIASGLNKSLSLKDNFFNLLLNGHGQPLTGGCTGFGCGAAFNFVSVLPDGEVHACRKFPSLLGNIFTQSLTDIHASKQAERYRAGSTACLGCTLRPVCRGCPAVTYGFGLDVFSARDPYCFGPCQPLPFHLTA
jgi:selenobiotic family peptide radical SAM maturase